MAKDMAGKEVHEDDIVQLEMTTLNIQGVVKEFRAVPARGKARGPAKGFMRVAFQFDVPFAEGEAMVGVSKIAERGDYSKAARPIRALAAPAKVARRA